MILQDSKPVMFASRALTGAEKNYQNLERECLAMIWGMEKFHYFLYGKHFTLETDQKPLASIYRKHMVEISPRIQRLVVRSFPYQPFDVQYRRGKEIPLADALSRVSPTSVEEDGIQLPIVAVNLITSSVPVSSSEIELICGETARDPTLNLLRHYIHMGWPVDRRMLPQEIHTFWNYREDLSMENGLVNKGARLMIPSTLRSKVLEQIHEGHLGTEKCMLKARDSVAGQEFQPEAQQIPETQQIAEAAQQRNFERETNSHSYSSFNQLNEKSMLPVMPMTSVTTPATMDRDSKVGEITNPISSTGATRPTSDRGAYCPQSSDNTKTVQPDLPRMFLQLDQ